MSTSPRLRPSRAAFLLVLSMTAVLLPAVQGWAIVEVPALVEEDVTPRAAAATLRTSSAGEVSGVTTPDTAFSMVAAQVPIGGRVELRVLGPDGVWSEWWLLPSGADHVPDEDAQPAEVGVGEAAADHDEHAEDEGEHAQDEDAEQLEDVHAVSAGDGWTDPVFIDHGVAFQVRTEGVAPQDVDVTVMDAHGRSGAAPDRIRVPASQAAAAETPDGNRRPADQRTVDAPEQLFYRGAWGAAPPADDIAHATLAAYQDDDGSSDDGPYVDLGPSKDYLGAGVVHHTAGENDYAADEVAGIIRSIQRFHQTGRGWDDIGYNFVVDRFGRVWEGRDGGVARSVIGAHSGGWNTTSFGVAVLGDFTTGAAVPAAALEGVADLFAWKFDLHGIDPYGTHVWPNDGERSTVIGHRDVSSTACPGDIHGLLPQLRDAIAQRLAAGGEPVEEEPARPVFVDVEEDGIHAEAIFSLASAGVILGCRDEEFCPSEPVTRGQIASLVAKAFEFAPWEEDPSFLDVAVDSPHAPWIGSLTAHGSISGFEDGTYRARIGITRDQMAAILGRTLGLHQAGGHEFKDVDSRAPLAGWVYSLYDEGLVAGCTVDLFCPDEVVTRAQAASLLRAALDYAVERGLPVAPDGDAS